LPSSIRSGVTTKENAVEFSNFPEELAKQVGLLT